jgi:hypothetical protein
MIENYKAATLMSEDALKHIELMPITSSQINLPERVDFVFLKEDRVYAAVDRTL